MGILCRIVILKIVNAQKNDMECAIKYNYIYTKKCNFKYKHILKINSIFY